MSIQEIQKEIIEDFSFFDDWMERYEHLIELGKSLPLVALEHKTDDNLIKGCQSKVWLHAILNESSNTIEYTADSDAIITKGIIAVLVRVYNGQTPQDILQANEEFINEIGLKEHLSPTRANGLVSMVKQMKLYAVAFQARVS